MQILINAGSIGEAVEDAIGSTRMSTLVNALHTAAGHQPGRRPPHQGGERCLMPRPSPNVRLGALLWAAFLVAPSGPIEKETLTTWLTWGDLTDYPDILSARDLGRKIADLFEEN